MSYPTPKTAIILINLGTPNEPTPRAVRAYLREFLSDQRVIELPKILWQIILNVFVLTARSRRVAHAYASIWGVHGGDDSPIRAILKGQSKALTAYLQNHHPDKMAGVGVHIATTYGTPNIRDVVKAGLADGVERLIVLPLYPQYSATTTAAAFDILMKSPQKERYVPAVKFINNYHAHPLYIQALAQSVKRFWAQHGQADKLLMSFHGIPQPYADKGDPYATQCHTTARLLADVLGLDDDAWAISFQSRFGAQEWLKPYTDELLMTWGKAGVQSVQAISPAFSADCLETLEELAVENCGHFINAGGKSYAYIPALNTDELHIQMMADLVLAYL